MACGPATGKRRALNKDDDDALIDKAEKLKAGMRAKVEHPFCVLKRQFRFMWIPYLGLREKNGATLHQVHAIQFVDGAQ